MAWKRTFKDLERFVIKEYGGVIRGRGTPYPCSQEQIDAYTLDPYCCQGNDFVMSEYDAITILEDFLDPRRKLPHKVRAALYRIAHAMRIKDDWHPDVVIKAMHDIDTAFFMGRLEGNISIQWAYRLRLKGALQTLGTTYGQHRGCSTISLSMQGVFHAATFPRTTMWQVVFHELIHAFCYAACHRLNPTSYDHAQGWTDGHGYMFRRCLLVIEGRTKQYCDGLCIVSTNDITDFRMLREPWMP